MEYGSVMAVLKVLAEEEKGKVIRSKNGGRA